jgi:hypothetical protein
MESTTVPKDEIVRDEVVLSAAAKLLITPVSVINVGLQDFADELAAQGVPVVHVQWQPPAGGDPVLAALLAKLGG